MPQLKGYIILGLIVFLTTNAVVFFYLGTIITLVFRNVGIVARNGTVAFKFNPLIIEIRYCTLNNIILRWISSFILPYCPLNITEISCDLLSIHISIREVVNIILHRYYFLRIA